MDLRGNQDTIYGNFFFIFIHIYLVSYFTRVLVKDRNPRASPNPTQKGKTLFFPLYILMSPVANFNIYASISFIK